MTFEEFKTMICRPHERNFKVKGSWGVYDAYKYIRKNKWFNIGRPLKEHEFYTIIRETNKLLMEKMLEGSTIVFPHSMGRMEIRSLRRGAYFKNGKLKIDYPVDWNSTLRLWYESEEDWKRKTLVRYEDEVGYYIVYSKYNATYTNKCFYEFTANTFVRRALNKKILNGEIQTLW